MRIGAVKDGWKLMMIAHSPVETFDAPQPPEPIFDEELKRFVPLPSRAVQSRMYITIVGVMGRCGQGIILKDRDGK